MDFPVSRSAVAKSVRRALRSWSRSASSKYHAVPTRRAPGKGASPGSWPSSSGDKLPLLRIEAIEAIEATPDAFACRLETPAPSYFRAAVYIKLFKLFKALSRALAVMPSFYVARGRRPVVIVLVLAI